MLNDPLTSIKGIGPRRAELLGRLGLVSLRDMLYFAPRDYLDYARFSRVLEARHGDNAAFMVTLACDPKLVRIRRGLDMVTVQAYDDSGKVNLVWYNQPYRRNNIKAGDRFAACGRIDAARGLKLINPALYQELPGILPVYPLTKGLSQKILRDTAKHAIRAAGSVEDPLPGELLGEYGLMELTEALSALHFPPDMETLKKARYRLAFEDMLMLRLMLRSLKEGRGQHGIPFRTRGLKQEFIQLLPFEPTKAQLRVLDEIETDMGREAPMNRLVQGDVGSGKTVAALFAMYVAAKNGYQAALMAPTEILAAQHYETLQRYFPGDALLLTGGMKKRERDAALAAVAQGTVHAIVGTHALLSAGVEFARLGMVVADEQHRFGVRQRAAMSAKGESPDLLIMSATPIPRTLALLLFGELELSVIDQLPPGRKPIATRLVPPGKRADMYRFIEERAKNGAQAYVVCPLVERSDVLEEVASAKELYRELSQMLDVPVGLIYGGMGAAKKEEAAGAFRRGETAVLVSTTVIEVGVDVPNATVMVVENADRFGLAQLHQLRGRVGRGDQASYCFLLSGSDSDTAAERLLTLTHTRDGFEIAQKDLDMRGPGEFLGLRQHGLSEFSALSLASNMDALYDGQRAADKLLLNPQGETTARLTALARERLEQRLMEIAPN